MQENMQGQINKNIKSISLKTLLDVSNGEIFKKDLSNFKKRKKNSHDLTFKNVSPLKDALNDEISFIINDKYLDLAKTSRAGAILCTKNLASDIAQYSLAIPIVCRTPRVSFAKVSQLFFKPHHPFDGVATHAMVDKTAKIASTATIFPYVFIGPGASVGEHTVIYPGCFIGAASIIGHDCVLYPNVVIREGCVIGDRCIFNPGVVIGGDGFSFEPTSDENVKIPQTGGVEISDDVELGSNTTIDRATFGNTKIGTGTKLDNLVQIAHNVEVGTHCLIAAQTGISGSTKLGDRVIAGGQVGVGDHLNIGNNVILAGQAGVFKNIPSGRDIWLGTPSRPIKDAYKSTAILNKIVKNYKNKK